VQTVDDRDVSSLGGYFELLPGCHVIDVPSLYLVVGRSQAVGATTARWTFAVPMRAGHHYQFQIGGGKVPMMTGHFIEERDLRSNKTREFEHAASPKDIEACKEEAARSLGQEPGVSRS